MHPFSVGDIVTCIDDRPIPGHERSGIQAWPMVGRAYRVASLSSDGAGNHGITLAEIPTSPGSKGWHAWRFRKFDRAEDSFIKLLEECRARAEEHAFYDAILALVAKHRRTWAAPGGVKQARAAHLGKLLIDYGEWFLGECARYPHAAHLRAVTDLMFIWRDAPTETINTMNPWVVADDFPSICQAALCLPTQRPTAQRIGT